MASEDRLKEIVEEIVARIVNKIHPLKIILFGSAARGVMGFHSDIDLLIVVPTGWHRRQTAQKIYRNLIGVGFATDAIVVTEEDIIRFSKNPGMVIKPALEEGKVVYAA